MSSPLEQLVGQRVTESGGVLDYAQVSFGDAVSLTIYNDYTIGGNKTLPELSGLLLATATQDAERVILMFEDGTSLTVNLDSNAYHAPEAMALHREGHATVVWN